MKWTTFGKGLLTVAKLMVPKIAEVEDDIKAIKSGPEKKAAVLETILDSLDVAEQLGVTIMTDPRVVEALGKVNDALVEAHKVLERVRAEQG